MDVNTGSIIDIINAYKDQNQNIDELLNTSDKRIKFEEWLLKDDTEPHDDLSWQTHVITLISKKINEDVTISPETKEIEDKHLANLIVNVDFSQPSNVARILKEVKNAQLETSSEALFNKMKNQPDFEFEKAYKKALEEKDASLLQLLAQMTDEFNECLYSSIRFKDINTIEFIAHAVPEAFENYMTTIDSGGSGLTPVRMLAERNKMDKIKFLSESFPTLFERSLSILSEDGIPALHAAVEHNNFEMVKLIFESSPEAVKTDEAMQKHYNEALSAIKNSSNTATHITNAPKTDSSTRVSIATEQTKVGPTSSARVAQPEKIETVVGTAKVKRLSDNTEVEATIKKSYRTPGRVEYFAYIDGQQVGRVDLRWLRMENGTYVGDNNYNPHRKFYGDHIDNRDRVIQDGKQLSKVYIEWIESQAKDQYRGIGMLLFQTAIEYSYEMGCEGRIELEANRSSHCFYYKNGMRALNEHFPGLNTRNMNQRIEAALKEPDENKRETNDIEIAMYMTQEGIEDWKKKIEKNPVLKSENS